MEMYKIEFCDGTRDDAFSLEEARDAVRDLYPDALLGIDKFVVLFTGGLATVATLTTVTAGDPNAN